MKSVALHNLGCKVNSYEMDVMQQMLQEKGYFIVPFDQQADIYIVNTCSVTNIADRKSRQMLHKAKKLNPDAVVVALGCYVQTGTEKVETDACIDLAIGNNRKKDLIPILEEFLHRRNQHSPAEKKEMPPQRALDKTLDNTTIIDINHTDEYEEMQLEQTAEHTRAYIKIQDGCNQFCSYCIIPYARGRVRSRSVSDILHEVSTLSGKGYKEVVLTGIHISSYGVDLAGEDYNFSELKGEPLLELIREIARIDGIERIRLGSFEPGIVTNSFAKALSEILQVCPHFHLSLQSGCDSTLKRMNRQYTTEIFAKGVAALRDAFDKPAITTDVIVGFPQETQEEFEETKTFLEQIGFFEMHIFPYSKRQGTVAASMTGQLTEAVKKERSHILLELEQKQSMTYRRSFIGETEEVLLEEEKEIAGKTYMVGHTRRYVKVAILQNAQERLNSNEVVTGKVQGVLSDEILLME